MDSVSMKNLFSENTFLVPLYTLSLMVALLITDLTLPSKKSANRFASSLGSISASFSNIAFGSLSALPSLDAFTALHKD
jgi:hypothetical protein